MRPSKLSTGQVQDLWYSTMQSSDRYGYRLTKGNGVTKARSLVSAYLTQLLCCRPTVFPTPAFMRQRKTRGLADYIGTSSCKIAEDLTGVKKAQFLGLFLTHVTIMTEKVPVYFLHSDVLQAEQVGAEMWCLACRVKYGTDGRDR